MKSTFTLAIATAALVAAGGAFAERPASLAGTTWTVQTNRDAVQLVIATQGGAGAPGAATCRTINGHFNLTASAQGVSDGARCTPGAQTGVPTTTAAAEARTGASPSECEGTDRSTGGAAANVPRSTDAPRYAEAPKRSPHANPRPGPPRR
jgi:hypothetical protein